MEKSKKPQPIKKEKPPKEDPLKLDTLENCHKYIQEIIQEHTNLKSEMMGALKIISAFVLEKGGEVTIPAESMQKAYDSDTFLGYKQDPETKDFSIKVKATPPKNPQPKTQSVKKSDILVALDGSRLVH